MSEDMGGEYVTNASPQEAVAVLRGGREVLVLSHARPDGDAVGSAIAVARAIGQFGGRATIMLSGDTPDPIERVAAGHGYVRSLPDDAHEPDLIVIVDTGSWSQLEYADPWLRSRLDRVIIFDHHLRGDIAAPRRLVEPSCASTTQLLLRVLVDGAGLSLSRSLAEPLFIGLATDTGWFRHANAGAEVFADAARLLAGGVDKVRIYREIEESHPAARLRLEARALASMTWCGGDRAAIMSLSQSDFSQTGGDVSMLSGLVNMPLIVASVEAVVLLVESGPNRIKVSFRSKAGPDGPPRIDVNVLAGRIGGGGHAQAAGARIGASMVDARAQVSALLEEVLAANP